MAAQNERIELLEDMVSALVASLKVCSIVLLTKLASKGSTFSFAWCISLCVQEFEDLLKSEGFQTRLVTRRLSDQADKLATLPPISSTPHVVLTTPVKQLAPQSAPTPHARSLSSPMPTPAGSLAHNSTNPPATLRKEVPAPASKQPVQRLVIPKESGVAGQRRKYSNTSDVDRLASSSTTDYDPSTSVPTTPHHPNARRDTVFDQADETLDVDTTWDGALRG